MRILSAAIAGTLFGFGLSLSEMVNPARVAGFLDLFGNWDPTLALVMAGALTVSFVSFRFILGRSKPLLEEAFAVPVRRDVDLALVAGAVTFGVGWGLSGFCPGPAIGGLASGLPGVWVFVASMLAGMTAFELWQRTAAALRLPGRPRFREPIPHADA